MQITSSRIWTPVAASLVNDDNHCAIKYEQFTWLKWSIDFSIKEPKQGLKCHETTQQIHQLTSQNKYRHQTKCSVTYSRLSWPILLAYPSWDCLVKRELLSTFQYLFIRAKFIAWRRKENAQVVEIVASANNSVCIINCMIYELGLVPASAHSNQLIYHGYVNKSELNFKWYSSSWKIIYRLLPLILDIE